VTSAAGAGRGKSRRALSCGFTGGDERTRTADPLLAKQVLYQLSYVPPSPPGCRKRGRQVAPAPASVGHRVYRARDEVESVAGAVGRRPAVPKEQSGTVERAPSAAAFTASRAFK
jgi:hypothetical protein